MSNTSIEHVMRTPVIAILRGLQPGQAANVGKRLTSAGFLAIEVPLNRPNALQSIEVLRQSVGPGVVIGAGTVLSVSDVDNANAAGAELIISPNTDEAVIAHSKQKGLVSIPAFSTPSEAFCAINAGADGLKLFPFGQARVSELKAIKEVLPEHVPVFAVGGVSPNNYQLVKSSGAAGVGLGGALFKPEYSIDQIAARAVSALDGWNVLCD